MISILHRFSAIVASSPFHVATILTASATFSAAVLPPQAQANGTETDKPTVVLVHGAFAESSSWNGVTNVLLQRGYPVVAVANPLRGVKNDADSVAEVIDSIKGEVVLVGHSYGGTVITNAATGKPNVKALVYVAAFAPDAGETAFGLSGKFPGSTLGAALAEPVALLNGGKDLYIQQDKFRTQFAADVSKEEARLMAATQRPIAEAAGNEPSKAPAWKSIPSFFIFGSLDKNIPVAAQNFMAKRAGATKTVEIKGASHVVMISKPKEVAALIVEASNRK